MSGGVLDLLTQIDAVIDKIDVVWLSSMTDWTLLCAYRPQLRTMPSIYYMHEFQGTYPDSQDTGLHAREKTHFAMKQLTTIPLCTATYCNSDYLRREIMTYADRLHKKLPKDGNQAAGENRWLNENAIRVLAPGIAPWLSRNLNEKTPMANDVTLRIVWNHRMSPDKGPHDLQETIRALAAYDCEFHITGDLSANHHKEWANLPNTYLHGNLERTEYLQLLNRCDVVLSTALQENFGISVAEAVLAGCIPVVPNRVVYPTIYPLECCYDTTNDCIAMLMELQGNPEQRGIMNRRLEAVRAQLSRLDWREHSLIWDQTVRAVAG